MKLLLESIYDKWLDFWYWLTDKISSASPKAICISIIATILVVIIGFLGINHSNTYKTIAFDRQQVKAVKNKKPSAYPPTNGQFTYNLGTVRPNFDQLVKDKNSNVNMTYRGQVVIPDIKVWQPIYEGTSVGAIANGVGTMKPGQKFGQGNYSIFGHNYRSVKFGDRLLLTHLQTKVGVPGNSDNSLIGTKLGQKIYAYDGENVVTFKVISQSIKDSNDLINTVSDLNVHNNALITIVTEYVQSDNSLKNPSQKRIVIVGQEINSVSKDQSKNLKLFKGVS